MLERNSAGVAVLLTVAALLLAAASVAAPVDGRLTAESNADSPAKVWVFFTDKGLNRGGEEAAINAFRSGLSDRAIRRRAKAGFDVNINDLPVADRYVDAVAATGAATVVRSRWLNAVSVLAGPRETEEISALPFVREVRPVGRGTREPMELVPGPVGAPRSEAGRALDYGYAYGQLDQIQVPALHEEGFDGSGVIIAMLDTGFDTDHQAYRHLDIIGERDFINNDAETANQPGDHSSQDSHGTATLSCVGGKYPGQLYGGSYEASFVLCKTEIYDEEIQVEEDYWAAAIEYADSLGADIASSSLGYIDWYTYEDMDGNTAVVTVAADMAAARGLLVVNSMGNERSSPWTYLIAPADGDSVLAVGAVDINGDDTYFTSLGPTADGRIKPDIMAMGLSVYIATTADTASYGYSNGTSFSCPLTAGAVGLLLQGHPDWTPQDIIDALHETGTQSSSPDTLMGWGIVQAHDAMYSDWVGVDESDPALPRLVRASPNPASLRTTVSFRVPSRSRVTLSVYDASGRLVRALVAGVKDAGEHAVEWDGRDSSERNVASGVYFVRMKAGDEVYSSAKVAMVR
jgi:serine protease AprX